MTIGGRGHPGFPPGTSWLWVISVFGLASGCFGQTDGSYGGFMYGVSGSNISITGYAGPPWAITIPSSIPGVDGTVTAIASEAFWPCHDLTSVTIPSSVTSIGWRPFVYCTNLTAFAVDAQNPSYSSLGGVLFNQNQTTLVAWPPGDTGAYTIPGSVTSIGDSAFWGCIGLTSVIIPGSVSNIGDEAFYSCAGLTIPTIPASVTNIGDEAFWGCSGLTSVTIPGSVTSIGEEAFGCSGLTGAIILDGLSSIGDGAFAGCSHLTSATIPASVTSIGEGAFLCSGLTALTVDTQNPVYSSLGGVLFDKNQTTLLLWPGGKTGAYTIPASVTTISEDAFWGCSGLTSVTIPGSVTNIGEYAFGGGCSGLTSVTIGNGVLSIGDHAFEACSRLTSVTVPSSVTNIGDYAFFGCSGLTSVIIPGSVNNIGDDTFYWCSGLTSVTIPSGVTNIGEYAFEYCSGLTSAYFQGDAPSGFGGGAFDSTAPGFSIYYPSTASGWSTPTWNGYPAQPYASTPAGQQPLLTLTLGWGAVIPSFNHLHIGTNYQLQVSTDLSTWSNMGPVFTATNAGAEYPEPFGVANWKSLFFRLLSAP